MSELMLPQFPLRLSRNGAGDVTVYDPLRRKWVVLTPEERVRQLFTAYLINCLGYPPSLMANEVGLRLNGRIRRCDTVVWSPAGGVPLVIVEYKAPSVPITGAVFEQIARYNIVHRARYLMVSNGLRHYCCEVDLEGAGYRFLPAVPAYADLNQNK